MSYRVISRMNEFLRQLEEILTRARGQKPYILKNVRKAAVVRVRTGDKPKVLKGAAMVKFATDFVFLLHFTFKRSPSAMFKPTAFSDSLCFSYLKWQRYLTKCHHSLLYATTVGTLGALGALG